MNIIQIIILEIFSILSGVYLGISLKPIIKKDNKYYSQEDKRKIDNLVNDWLNGKLNV